MTKCFIDVFADRAAAVLAAGDAGVRKKTEKTLSDIGYAVLSFPSLESSFETLLSKPPSVLLVDVDSAGENQANIMAELKKNDVLSRVPVLFLIGAADRGRRDGVFSSGADDYLVKPLVPSEVRTRLGAHVELSRAKAELEEQEKAVRTMIRKNLRLQAKTEKEKLLLEKRLRSNEWRAAASDISTTIALVKLAEYRDIDTGEHIARTSLVCRLLAEELRKQPDFHGITRKNYVEIIERAAPLHDIGKVGVPDDILLKPGKLTDEEWTTMKKHTIIGASILREVQENDHGLNPVVNMGIEIALYHHEKWNGSGYPYGLSGDAIPPCARIMAVADVYDALRSRRPYKDPMPRDKAMSIVLGDSGKHFDPAVVEKFKMVEELVASRYE